MLDASMIPDGLNYVNLKRREGIGVDYSIILNKDMFISAFRLIDTVLMCQLKNYGQIPSPQFVGEIQQMELEDSESAFINCDSIPLTPLQVNGQAYVGPPINFLFERIVAVDTVNKFTSVTKPCIIYYLNPAPLSVTDYLPVKYLVDVSIYDIWYYIKNCQMPYYYGGLALGGQAFLNQ